MKLLGNKYIKSSKIQSFSNGFLQSFDVFGNMNTLKDIYSFSKIKRNNYMDSFINVGNSIRKAIDIESKKYVG